MADHASIQQIRQELADAKPRALQTQRRSQRLLELAAARLRESGKYAQATRTLVRASNARTRAAATAERLAEEAAPGDPVD